MRMEGTFKKYEVVKVMGGEAYRIRPLGMPTDQDDKTAMQHDLVRSRDEPVGENTPVRENKPVRERDRNRKSGLPNYADGFSCDRVYKWPSAIERAYALGPTVYAEQWKPALISGSRLSASGILDFSPSPQEISSKTYDCDIFLVHALGGSVIESWAHQQSGVIWPRDLLQKTFQIPVL